MSATDERTLKVIRAARAVDADWMVLTSPDAVAYACGHSPPVETGPSPFDGGPAAAIVDSDGNVALLTHERESAAAATSRARVVETYDTLGFYDPTPLPSKYAAAAARLCKRLGVDGRVGVQSAYLPHSLAAVLNECGALPVAFDIALARERAIKTPEEVSALRACARLTDIGQATARTALRVGRSELEVFHDVRAAIEETAGERLAVAGDFVSGVERTAAIGGWPTSRRLASGDPVICDLAPRLGGYWGDSCTTLVVGEPSRELTRFHAVAMRALEHARGRLTPGRSVAEVDSDVRQVIEEAGLRDPIHVGHGIGTSVCEVPQIVPSAEASLAEGMVIMIEPGAYDPSVGGVRVEQMFLVTTGAAECLSGFPLDLFEA